MRERVTHNLGLKIIALIIALVLWIVIINVDDPVRMAEFDNVEVVLENTDVITDNNKICEVLDNTNYITVRIYASRSILDSIDASNIKAVADLSELEDTIKIADTANGNAYLDNVKIKLSTNKYNNDLNSINSSSDYVKVSVEDLKIQKSIFVDVKGEPTEGYMVGNVTTASNLVRISGPASEVNRIDTAKVLADVSGFTGTISWDADIRLYDSEGNEIISKSLTKSLDKVSTKVELLEKKEVPIVTTATGTPAEGYGTNGNIVISPSSVVIAGAPDVIDDITKLTIPSTLVDIGGLTQDYSNTINLKQFLPNGVVFADSNYKGQVSITVGIEAEASITIGVPLTKLEVENVPKGYTYQVVEPTGNMILAVQGMRTNLEAIDRSAITAKADLSKVIAEGDTPKEDHEYEVEVDFELDRSVKMQAPYTIKLKLMKEE